MKQNESRVITVSIVDDNDGVRNRLQQLIDETPGYRCPYAYANGDAALRGIPSCPTDVVLMDIQMPGMSGIECVARLKMLRPEQMIIMITVYEDDSNVFPALRAGACGYMLKRSSPEQVLDAIADAANGGAPMSSLIARKVVAAFQNPAPPTQKDITLTERENELLGLLAKGYANKQIAERMGLTLESVKTYLKRVYDKLHVHCRTEAVVHYLNKTQ